METNEKQNNAKFWVPSLKVEKKTQAFNKYLWVFVAFISTLSAIVVFGLEIFVSSELNLVSTFFGDNFYLILVIFLAFVALGYQGFMMVYHFMVSYKIEDNKITQGFIQANAINPTLLDLLVDVAGIKMMLSNLKEGAVAGNTIINVNSISTLISLNGNPLFVEKCFDTNCYKKTEYINPRLVKETKHSYIYMSDNNKKLVIPKVYEGMCNTENLKPKSFLWRILKKSIVVFLIFILLAVLDISISSGKNSGYVSNITSTISAVEKNLSSYGFSETKSTTYFTFKKTVGTKDKRTSEIKYKIDKKGNIQDIAFELYYDNSSTNIDSELTYIFGTLNDTFNKNEINNFISVIKQNINGDRKYATLKSNNGKYNIMINKSDKFVTISHDFKY